MHIVAFNSSPRDNQTSKTELVLQKFLEGARRAGATAETLYLRNYKIKHCLGCYSCWIKTPGRCVQQDDMADELFDRYLKANQAVLATPIYHATMNARMKLFIERTMPMIDPLAGDDDASGPPYRFEKVPKVVALSVAGYWDQAMFQPLSQTLRMGLGRDLVAEIYRHSSEFLTVPEFQPQVQAVLAAVAQAGEEVVRQGRVTPATQEALTRELAPPDILLRLSQEFWKQGQEEAARPSS